MADNPDGLPIRGELIWKKLFAATEPERQTAERLLAAGLYVDNHEHPQAIDQRMDSSGDKVYDSPSGQIIRDIVDSQPEELPFGDPGADEPTPTNPPPPLIPTPPVTEEFGRSMKILMREHKPPEPEKPKYTVAPPPEKPATDLPFINFDSNDPL
jgi:hypothetical protein